MNKPDKLTFSQPEAWYRDYFFEDLEYNPDHLLFLNQRLQRFLTLTTR